VDSADEDSVRISYLTKLPKFVDWPFEEQGTNPSELLFCVLGDEEFNTIRSALRDQTVKGKPVMVLDAKRQGSLSECHVLYIAASEGWRTREILGQIRNAPILSISAVHGFCAQGGMVGLVKDADRLKFEINAQAAKQSKLRISAQLMTLAVKVWQ
jgi:hypothetical protein